MRTAPPQGPTRLPDRSAALTLVAGGVAAFALFILSRPYLGIAQDGILYVGRAVADGDPANLGRDILFAHDGQSRFSLFTLVADRLVAALGPGAASWWLAHVALALWFGAAAAFAAQFARGAALWAMLAGLALAGSAYGGDGGFRYGEPYAIPRPLAEAGVLLALAAWLSGRRGLAVACLAAAALVHPIMAAGGVAIVGGLQARRDRRWVFAFAGGALVFVALAAAGLPFARRLFTAIDPDWSRALHVTNVIYPARWSADTWAAIALQIVTVLAAARTFTGEHRRLLVATAVVAVAGVAAATILGEWAGSLLILQVQPWRPLWLLSATAAMTMPIVAVALWRAGPVERLALACLAVAWFAESAALRSGATAVGAALLVARPQALATQLILKAAWLAVALVGLVWCAQRVRAVIELGAAPGSAGHLVLLFSGDVWRPLAVAAVVAWLIAGRPRVGPVPLGALALVLVALAWRGGDARSPLMRRLEAWRPDPALATALADLPGEVLWLRAGVLEPWVLAGRPNWISAIQGSSMLFSGDLATLWTARIDRLIAARLGDESDRAPNLAMAERRDLTPSLADIAAFCAAPDAPVMLFAPLDGGFKPPATLPYGIYRMPAPRVDVADGPDGAPAWSESRSIATIPCRAR